MQQNKTDWSNDAMLVRFLYFGCSININIYKLNKWI